jgi:DNA mismatch repair protein MLH1
MESIRLSQPAPISEVVLLALEYEEAGWTAEDGPKDELAKDIAKLLVEKAPMLEEYFAIKVDSRGNLCALPEIVHQHAPEMEALPIFLLRLAIEVRRICQVGRYAFNLFRLRRLAYDV